MHASSGLEVLTIGHSNLLLVDFIAHLHANAVATVVDVRSNAASRLCPWFGFTFLLRALADEGIGYTYLGDRLGDRPPSRSLCLPNGKPDFVLLAKTPSYRSGIDDLLAVAARRRVAVMCSEGDFRRCHRQTLIGRTLRERGVALSHILPDGSLVPDPPEQLSFLDAML
jgi:uncharacterized protein (DUF488 family)